MFGHHESAQAKVLYAQDVTGGWEDVHHVKIEFVLEVRPPTGQAFRAKTTHHFIMFLHYPQVGDVVSVKYNPKSLDVELDLKDDVRYGELHLKHQEQVDRQKGKAQRDALLSASPGTPLSPPAAGRAGRAGLDPELQELMQMEEAERRAASATSAGGTGMNSDDPELQELMQMEEAERRTKHARQQGATGPAEMQMLRQELEYTGASGQAKILRKQQAGQPMHHLTPFLVEVQVQPDNMGFPFQCSFTTWIDPSKGTLIEGYMIPVKYDPQNTARIVFLLPA